MDGRAAELVAAVGRAAEGTPYVVTPTDDGFDLTLEIANATWYGLFNKAGLSRVFTHHVTVRPDGTYTILDDSRTVDWVAGVPEVSVTAQRILGRTWGFEFQKIWALDENFRPARVVDYQFSASEGRALITEPASALGLKERWHWTAKVALFFAVLAIGGLLVGGLGLGIWYLLLR